MLIASLPKAKQFVTGETSPLSIKHYVSMLLAIKTSLSSVEFMH